MRRVAPLFGYFPSPEADRYDEVVRLVRLADTLGLDLVGIQDHPYQSRYLDTWTLLSVLAVQTTRVRLFPDVADLPLRYPPMLAKAAATLDRISGGRVELGLGTGALWEAIEGMGVRRRNPAESVSALEEAVAVLRLMWSGERSVRFDGEYYWLRGTHPGPAPAHAIGIWLGAYGPRMLGVTGRMADGWLPSATYLPPERLGAAQARIDDAAADAGRSPSDVLRLYNVWGTIGPASSAATGPFDGPVSTWVETLSELAVDGGIDGFIFGPGDGDAEEPQLQRFATEVAPAVASVTNSSH